MILFLMSLLSLWIVVRQFCLSKPPPEIPLELQENVVDMLLDFPEGLRVFSMVSKAHNVRARSLLFERIDVLSVEHLLHLSSLLSSDHCTIPRKTSELILALERPWVGRKLKEMVDGVTFSWALGQILEYFHVKVSVSLSFPWAIGQHFNLGSFPQYGNMRNIKVFVLQGGYTWLHTLPAMLNQMMSLETLIVDATFQQWTTDHPRCTFLCPGLKEIAVSTRSLPVTRWMCSLPVDTRPESLQVVRFKYKDLTALDNVEDIERFFEVYGSTLEFIFVWFDDVWDDLYEGTPLRLWRLPSERQTLNCRHSISVGRRYAPDAGLATAEAAVPPFIQ